MIAYQDFVPKVRVPAGFRRLMELETLRVALLEANRWITESGVRVLNVETVVLPNIHSKHEEGSEDSMLSDHGGMISHWHQFIRVWYELDDGPPPVP